MSLTRDEWRFLALDVAATLAILFLLAHCPAGIRRHFQV
jgi:hypothetical protein